MQATTDNLAQFNIATKGDYPTEVTQRNPLACSPVMTRFCNAFKILNNFHLFIIFRVFCPDNADRVMQTGLMVLALLKAIIAKSTPFGRFGLVLCLEKWLRRENKTLETGHELDKLQVVVELADLTKIKGSSYAKGHIICKVKAQEEFNLIIKMAELSKAKEGSDCWHCCKSSSLQHQRSMSKFQSLANFFN